MKVTVTVTGTQTVDNVSDNTTHQAQGMMMLHPDGAEIAYVVHEADQPPLPMRLRVHGGKAEIERGGACPSLLVVEPERRNQCRYATPYGVIPLGVTGRQVVCELNENGGKLRLVYALDNGAGPVSEQEICITVCKQ